MAGGLHVLLGVACKTEEESKHRMAGRFMCFKCSCMILKLKILSYDSNQGVSCENYIFFPLISQRLSSRPWRKVPERLWRCFRPLQSGAYLLTALRACARAHSSLTENCHTHCRVPAETFLCILRSSCTAVHCVQRCPNGFAQGVGVLRLMTAQKGLRPPMLRLGHVRRGHRPEAQISHLLF